MRFDATVLRSKVARRIFMLFVFCALVPIAALAIISFGHVTKQLNLQSQRRLQRAGKAAGLAIMERLLFLDAKMRMVVRHLDRRAGAKTPSLAKAFGQDLTGRFKGLALVKDGATHLIYGHVHHARRLTDAEWDHLRTDRAVVSSHPRPGALVFMARALDPETPQKGALLGEIDTSYLWGFAELAHMTEMCVLDPTDNVITSSIAGPTTLLEQMRARSRASRFEWKHKDKEYLASSWVLPLKYVFLVPRWTVVLSESKADVLAPMANFKSTFLLVILVSLFVVLLFSIGQIRRSLVPLEKLSDGTRRIAKRDFDSRVTISSGDEFEELADAFNAMSSQLGRQFKTLATIGEIDRAILSALDTRKIVDTVIARIPDVFSCDRIGVVLADSAPNQSWTYLGDDSENDADSRAVEITPEEIRDLLDNPESMLFVHRKLPRYLSPMAEAGVTSAVVLPIFVNEEVAGAIALGRCGKLTHSREDLDQVRQLASQVAVALSNAGLLEELDQLNWGTLIALARTIDAKSPWTAGHSERGAEVALRIAEEMGLSREELDDLHRGALLHDIGKIAVPPEILDKKGKLTEEEMMIMREHPRAGARILRPIAAYTEVIPVVEQHHEWFDGSGYPDGLSGEEIHLLARIYAVADVFDALCQDRPYREGLGSDATVEYIQQKSGTQFDPKVVDALVTVIEQEKEAKQANAEDRPSLSASSSQNL